LRSDENETDAASDFKTEPAAVQSSTPTATAKVIGFVSLGDKVSIEKKNILGDERERVDSHKEERSSAADADSTSKADATAVGSATPAVDASAAKAQGAVELAGKHVAKSTLPRSATVEEASAPHVTNLVVVAPQVAAVALKRSSSSASAVAATAAARLAASHSNAKQAAKAAENGPAAEKAVSKALPAKRQADRDARS
jgi:hypothetical protein